jgi:hypothetical protein
VGADSKGALSPLEVPGQPEIIMTAAGQGRDRRAAAPVAVGLPILLAILLVPGLARAADFASGLAALVARAEAGDSDAVLVEGRRLLRQHRDDGAVRADDRREVYRLLLDAARNQGNLRTGNTVAADLLKQDRRIHGQDGVERVPGLYLVAAWHRWAGRGARELNHGPRDGRLAPALTALADARIHDRVEAEEAGAALARARSLDYPSTRESLLARSDALAAQGDWEVVFGDPAASGGWYEAAWRTLADSALAGPRVANERFAVPRPLSVRIPDEPFRSLKGRREHFAVGRVTELRIREVQAPVESLPDPVLQAFRDARYRPRVLGGRPQATTDHGYVLRLRDDPGLQPRRLKFGGLDGRY